ncbi:hypothetical protein [Chryseobacterium sp. Mn2064]|uniref:hypothetical protein n=1 Tax=Chryseobacterium sp. Mn2064 TaxID=3395263 RepID=UPI003BD299BB
MMNLKSYLELKVDDQEYLSAFTITGSNIQFSGTIYIHEDSRSLADFANSLIDFPKYEKKLFFEMGHKDSRFSYFSISLYPTQSLSHIGVQITMVTDAHFRDEDQCKIQFEIIVEPSAIDEFRKALSRISHKGSGNAILYGKDNRI